MKKYRIREGSLAWHCNEIAWCIKKNKKRIIAATVGVAVIVIAVCFGGENEPAEANMQPQQEKSVEVKNEPFKAQSVEEMICMKCDEYGIDPALPIAIARLETGHFTSEAYKEGNNVGGLSHDEEPIEFKDLERGVEAFVMNLYHNYYEQGLDTVKEIAPKYCPLNADHWAEVVTEIMEGGEV